MRAAQKGAESKASPESRPTEVSTISARRAANLHLALGEGPGRRKSVVRSFERPRAGEIERFLTGPAGCEIIAATAAVEGRAVFINVSRPGESPSERVESDAARCSSKWLDFNFNGRPRSATVVSRKKHRSVICAGTLGEFHGPGPARSSTIGAMKDDLNALLVFARVAQSGSFTAAAKALDMPKATVSGMVSALETRLGTRLLERTTRKVSLTEAGRVYLASCQRALEAVQDGRAAVEALAAQPQGRLRLSAPFALSRSVLAPLLAAFITRYPQLRVTLDVNNRPVDLLAEDQDLALRVGAPPPNAAQTHRITVFSTRLYASPSYLQRRAMPRHPDELPGHDLLGYADRDGRLHWRLRRGDEVVLVEARPRLSVNEPDTNVGLIAGGCGIGWLPSFLVREDFVRCLPDWDDEPVELNALLPTARSRNPKAMALIEFLRQSLGPAA
ncbi:MAG: LysR family transcriptional regulator [Planctomycetes bacterium]|nr:LysR family transcriptional regulator [Planctomycetota bacterium]